MIRLQARGKDGPGTPARETLALCVDGVRLSLAAMVRPGALPVILYLHGFGGNLEDFAAVAERPAFAGRALVAYDAPGCGGSLCEAPEALSVDFLRRTGEALLDRLALERFHLAGHSMGGAAALKLAAARPGAVLSFTNIEGNLAPEDCFLSRRIIDHPAADPAEFLDDLRARVRAGDDPSRERYAAQLAANVRPEAVEPIFRSLVEESEKGALLDLFGGLPTPRLFVYGARNRGLSYLDRLRAAGVGLAEIEGAGHFPMYANPGALWRALADFIEAVERGGDGT